MGGRWAASGERAVCCGVGNNVCMHAGGWLCLRHRASARCPLLKPCLPFQVPACITGLTRLTLLDLSFNSLKSLKPGDYLKRLVVSRRAAAACPPRRRRRRRRRGRPPRSRCCWPCCCHPPTRASTHPPTSSLCLPPAGRQPACKPAQPLSAAAQGCAPHSRGAAAGGWGLRTRR